METTIKAHPFSRLSAVLLQSLEGFRSGEFRSRLVRPRVAFHMPPVFKNKKFLSFLGVVVLVMVSFFAGSKMASPSGLATSSNSDDSKLQAPVAKATEKINRSFSFPLKDAAGKEVSKIKYTITDVSLQDEIIVKGQRAHAVAGRTFLMLNIKIENPYTKSIEINSKDYVRLSVNGNEAELPGGSDIHNDPVQIQAISTKPIRLGFPINSTDKNLKLFVGEINGKKETITLGLLSQ